LLCFERTNAKDGAVWSVKVNGRWLRAREVFCAVPVVTVWKGRTAKQPRAYLEGRGIVRRNRPTGFLDITAAS
jgi:hypothetical protein